VELLDDDYKLIGRTINCDHDTPYVSFDFLAMDRMALDIGMLHSTF
jgi:hypothetical protein